MGSDIMETTDNIMLMFDIYKMVKQRNLSPSKIPPCDEIAKRIVFTGAGYALVSLMDAAFAKFLCTYKDKTILCSILSDTCFCISPLADEIVSKTYNMDFTEYLKYKQEAAGLYGEILSHYILELENSLEDMGCKAATP